MENNNRRNFLKNSAVLGSALIASSAVALAMETGGVTTNENSIAQQKSKMRKLGSGKNSLEVSALGLGCMEMSYRRRFIPGRPTFNGIAKRIFFDDQGTRK